MRKHLQYLRYVIRHKWFVWCACWRHRLIWQGIIHDWHKLLPSEWFPYVEMFYGERGYKFNGGMHWEHREHELARLAFDEAWLKHQHRGPHHWQHWVLREDSGATKALPMPLHFAREMCCDWEGAGRAITGKKEWWDWYEKNKEKMLLHPATIAMIEKCIEISKEDGD